jgi:hypothetical protein
MKPSRHEKSAGGFGNEMQLKESLVGTRKEGFAKAVQIGVRGVFDHSYRVGRKGRQRHPNRNAEWCPRRDFGVKEWMRTRKPPRRISQALDIRRAAQLHH